MTDKTTKIDALIRLPLSNLCSARNRKDSEGVMLKNPQKTKKLHKKLIENQKLFLLTRAHNEKMPKYVKKFCRNPQFEDHRLSL